MAGEASFLVSLSSDERTAMAWVARETPTASRFLLVPDTGWETAETIEWFPVLTGRVSVEFSGHTVIVFSVAWHPKDQRIASVGFQGPLHTVKVWDARNGRTVFTLRHSCVYDPVDDRVILFGGSSISSYLGDVWMLSLATNVLWDS